MATAVETFANQPETTVSSGGTDAPSGGTVQTWTVASSSSFPAADSTATPPTQFHVADVASVTEIIAVTNVSGDTWTVTRGAESTTPVTHDAGFTITQVVSAGALGSLLPEGGGTISGPVSNTNLAVYHLDSYTGTDDQKMASALSAVTSGNGGIIQLAAKSYSFADQWSTSYQGTQADQVNIVIRGCGGQVNGGLANSPSAGVTTCTFTYDGSGAGQMDFQHNGLIEICGITFVDTTYTVPFFFCTYSTPEIHDCTFVGVGSRNSCTKDAIILGGDGSGSGDNAKFFGYGGRIYRNYFSAIRRVVTFGAGANSNDIFDNCIDQLCGASVLPCAPFHFNGTSTHPNTGNFIRNNQNVEMTYYSSFTDTSGAGNAYYNKVGPNDLEDASYVTCSVWDSTCQYNLVEDSVWRTAANYAPSIDPSGTHTIISSQVAGLSPYGQILRGGDLIVRNQGGHSAWGEDYYGNKASIVGAVNNSVPADSGAYITIQPGTRVTDASTYDGSPYVVSDSATFVQSDIESYCLTVTTAIALDTFITDIVLPSTLRYLWQPSAAFSLGDVIAPVVVSAGLQVGNGHLYQCTTAGTTSSTAPTWPTGGGTVTDGTVVWTDLGTSATAAICSSKATATTTGNTFCWSRPDGSAVLLTKFMNHHIIGSGTGPSYSAGAAAGTGATVSVSGKDIGHIVTVTCGSSGTTTGTLATGTPGEAFSGAGESGSIAVTPQNSATAALGLYGSFDGSKWTISCTTAPSASASIVFSVLTLG